MRRHGKGMHQGQVARQVEFGEGRQDIAEYQQGQRGYHQHVEQLVVEQGADLLDRAEVAQHPQAHQENGDPQEAGHGRHHCQAHMLACGGMGAPVQQGPQAWFDQVQDGVHDVGTSPGGSSGA